MSKKINLLIMEETESWREDIQKACEKIYGVYLYCPDEVTHCCEITPSYECHFVYSVSEKLPDDEEERDKVGEDIRDGDSYNDSIRYYHCSVIDKLPTLSRQCHCGTCPFGEYDLEDFSWDDVVEEFEINPFYWYMDTFLDRKGGSSNG